MKRLTALLVVALSATDVLATEPSDWLLFKSTQGFTVRYPKNWSRIAPDDSSLDILSAGHREEGVVIGTNQSEIEVRSLSGDLKEEIAKWTKYGDRVGRTSTLTRESGYHCDNVKVVSMDFSDGLGVPEHDVGFFCLIGGKLFLTSVRYWKDDLNGPAHVIVGKKVAKSLRSY